jgi:hypothetical protein
MRPPRDVLRLDRDDPNPQCNDFKSYRNDFESHCNHFEPHRDHLSHGSKRFTAKGNGFPCFR